MSDERSWYKTYTWVLAGLILTVYAMTVAKTLLLPMLFALLFSILLAPICDWLERFRVPRVFSTALVILGVGLIIGGLLFLFYRQILLFTEDLDMMERRLRELIGSLEGGVSSWFGPGWIGEFDSLEDRLFSLLRDNLASLTQGLAGAASVVTSAFLIPVYLFLILMFRNFLQEFLLQLVGRGNDVRLQRATRIFTRVGEVVQYYIVGVGLVILILATLYSSMLWLLGVRHAIFFGVFAGMLNIIPFIGPLFGSILPILYALVTMDSWIYPIIIIAGFYLVQLLEGNLLTPVIVGSRVSMNALVTLVLLLIGAKIWGLAGMILFIPLGAILKVVFDEIESLQPFGFLLGRVPSEMQSSKGPLARRINLLGRSVRDSDS
ncbi:MAG: AI-2E family transporter [Balneolaceae bacterium]